MRLASLFEMLQQAHALSGHRDFVVIGSLSILGLEDHFDIPDDMTMSNDVDCYTRDDPERIFELVGALGENSPYHLSSGFYLDAVSPALPSLPDGWAARLLLAERAPLRAWFLEPNDAALSKYARGEARDRRWIRAGIRAGVISLAVVRARFGSTGFYDAEEMQRARRLIDDDDAWFETLKAARPPG